MDAEELKELMADAVNDADLHPEEIPSIDLYLDQIISLVSCKLKEGSPRFFDRVLTKTMVNNYSKDGLLSPINGKKYTKEHFLQMLTVYSMKNTLSIGEIKRVLQNIYQSPEYSVETFGTAYSHFLDLKQRIRDRFGDFIEDLTEKTQLDLNSDADYFVMLLSMACLSSYLKSAAQALLEARYPDLDEERAREEREKREEARRLREEKKAAAKKKAAEASKKEEAGD